MESIFCLFFCKKEAKIVLVIMSSKSTTFCYISQPIDELGKLAAKALFNEIKTKKKENIKVVVEPKIIIRKSTRAL